MSDAAAQGAPATPAASTASAGPAGGLVAYAHWIYALHSLSVLCGLLTSGSVAGRFVFGLPSLVAVIMNYARRSETHGTYLESHFHWQIRTFWYALLAMALTLLISMPLILVLALGILTAMAGLGIIGIWVIYRVARGWLALRAGEPMPLNLTGRP
jgi:uncharacterized membrane protein